MTLIISKTAMISLDIWKVTTFYELSGSCSWTLFENPIRRIDTGGDEFFVLLPETELQNAKQTAEKIRTSFNDRWTYGVAYRDIDLSPVTLSVGVAQLQENETAEALIKRADVAMYEAKRQDGDRVITHRHIVDE